MLVFRAQRCNQPLPSSSPCMTEAAAVAGTMAAAGSSTLSSSSATKFSSSGTFSAGRGKDPKAAPFSAPAREQVSFCSQLTPVAFARPSQVNDAFISPVTNGSLLVAATPPRAVGSSGGASTMVASTLFCSPVAAADTHVDANGEHSSSGSQSQVQLDASSVSSTQRPSVHATPVASQRSSLSVEFPPSFPYRLSQQEHIAPPVQRHSHNAMDIGDYCVGMLPSLCTSNFLGPPPSAIESARPSLACDPPAAASALVPATLSATCEDSVQLAVDSAAAACDGSARKRRRVVASRNLGAHSLDVGAFICHKRGRFALKLASSGRIIVSLVSKDDAMYSNAYLSSLGACLSDVNCGAFDILVIDNLRASKKVD